MGGKPGPARILGPYSHRRGWRFVTIIGGTRQYSETFASEAEARREMKRDAAELADVDLSCSEAIDVYERYLTEKGNRASTVALTIYRLRGFFPADTLISALRERDGRALYEVARTKPTRFGKPASADTHRNTLNDARRFLAWCVKQKFATFNALEAVEGMGTRTRGKEQLTFDEGRKWLETAERIARGEAIGFERRGDAQREAERSAAAVAAMTTLILNLRASEAAWLQVRNVDLGGTILRVERSKTEKGKRKIEIPPRLRPFLLELTRGRDGEAPLFGEKSSRDVVYRTVQRICAAAKVPVVSAHAMRGLHASIATAAGTTSAIVADAMGHASAVTTNAAYATADSQATGRMRRVMQVLNGGLADGDNESE